MRLRPKFAFALLLVSATPLFAQATAPDLASAVALVQTETSVARVIEADLNMDGRPEALLLAADGCDGDACPWSLVGSYPDGSGWGVVATGFGARTDLVETYPSGQVIRSDGVIMAWDGFELRPYYDLLDAAPSRRARAGETRLLGRLLSGSFRPILTRVHEIDPFQRGESWKVFIIADSGEGSGAPERFHLVDPEGSLRHSGASFSRPWVFVDVDETGPVMRLVSETGAGLLVEGVR